jgi:uncharacterized protein
MSPSPSSATTPVRTAKLVVTGPFGAGKSTLLSTLAGPVPLTGEHPVSRGLGALPGRTTVAMESARLPLAEDLALAVYATPGQDRFGFLWELLTDRLLGYVLLLDATRPDTLPAARHVRGNFESQVQVPSAVGLTRVLGDLEPVERRVRAELELPPEVPVLSIDARDRDDAKRLVHAVLVQALESERDQPFWEAARARVGDAG